MSERSSFAGVRANAVGSVTTRNPPAFTQSRSASANGRESVSPRGSHTTFARASRSRCAARRSSVSNTNGAPLSSPSREWVVYSASPDVR